MALLLKRNATRDPWFTNHSDVQEGEIVCLVKVENEPERSAEYPPEISIKRKKSTKDRYCYKASLCCYDYVGTYNGS